MHANAVSSEQVGKGVLAQGIEEIHGERLSIPLNPTMATINHCDFRTSTEAGKACFNRVRLKSVIGIEERDVSRMSELKAKVTSA